MPGAKLTLRSRRNIWCCASPGTGRPAAPFKKNSASMLQRMPLVWLINCASVIGSAQAGRSLRWRRMLSSMASLPSSASSITASAQKCLVTEATRRRVEGVRTAGNSTLARPKPRRYSGRPRCAMPTARPGWSLRLWAANSASSLAASKWNPVLIGGGRFGPSARHRGPRGRRCAGGSGRRASCRAGPRSSNPACRVWPRE